MFSLGPDEIPVGISRWGDQYCLFTNAGSTAMLRCASPDGLCQTTSAPQLSHELFGPLARPVLTELPGGLALLTDSELPQAMVLQKTDSAEGLSVQYLPLDLPVLSTLVRRDRYGVVLATRGALWSLDFDLFAAAGSQIQLEPLLQNQGLPMVNFKLLRDPQQGGVYLYGPQSQEPDAPYGLIAIDLQNQRMLGQVASFKHASGAISLRPGHAELLLGLGGPPRIASFDLGDGEQHSFADLASAWTSRGLISLQSSRDGRIVLAVDSAAKLWFVY